MAVVGGLVANLTLNKRGFDRGLKGARSSITSFATGAMQSIAGVGGALAGLAGITGIGGALTFGVKLAAQAEQAEAQFTTLLGSASAAKTVLADLEKFAASTPFELAGLRDSARVLLAFGFSQDELMDRMQMLGDIAAGTGKPIADFVDIFGKVKASGRTSMEEINRLAERGVPIYRALAETLGKPEKAIRDLVSSGKVGFAELDAALKSTVEQGGLFAGGMQRQSTTVMGLFSTLKDNVAFVLQDLGQALIDSIDLKAVMERSIAMIQTFRTQMVDAIEAVAFGWRNAQDIAQLALIEMQLSLYELVPGTEQVMGEVAGILLGTWDAAAVFFQSWVQNVISGAMEIRNAFEAVFKGIWSALQAVFSGENPLTAFTDSFVETLAQQKNAKSGGNPFTQAIEQFQTTRRSVADGLASEGGLGASLETERDRLLDRIASRERDFAERTAKPPDLGPDAGQQKKDDGDTQEKRDDKPVAALRRGSSEAFSAIFAAMRGGRDDPAKKTAENTKQAAEASKIAAEQIKETNRLLQNGDVQVVGSLL